MTRRPLALAALALALPLAACHTTDDSASSTSASPAMLPAGDVNDSAMHVGERAPNVTLITPQGTRVGLYDYLRDGPLVLNFYRGNWCPYCRRALSGWDTYAPQFRSAGATLIAVSPESLPNIGKTAATHTAFPILEDPNHDAAKAFGVNFTLDDATQQRYQTYGVDLSTHNADSQWQLPIPATFVIDRTRTIRYIYANTDYKTRADPAEVLRLVQALR